MSGRVEHFNGFYHTYLGDYELYVQCYVQSPHREEVIQSPTCYVLQTVSRQAQATIL